MKKPAIKQLFFTWIILALLSACAGPGKTQYPPEPATLSASPIAASIPLPSPTHGASTRASQAAPDYWPTQDWRSSTPEQQGMDSAQIAKVFDAIQQANETIHSVTIVRNGDIVTEAYYAPFRPDARQNLNSDTLSVVSILVGIAIQQGLIKGVDQKMLDFFPDREIKNMDARKQAITIGDLLSMTSGLREDDSGKDNSADWVQYVLDMPVDNNPGEFQNMNDGGYHLLCAIIQKTSGMTPLAFADMYLFEPLGISGAKWLADPQGINNGGSLLYLVPRDTAKIGYLYLNNGEWNGKQIVPKEYVLASTKHLFEVYHSTPGWGYGYGWWIAPDGSYYAEGYYGQVIAVKPEQGIVTVIAGGTREDSTLDVEALVDQFIIPAVKSAGALPENPAGTALLKDKIAALEKPTPQPIPPIPKLAQAVSGKKYLLDDGEAFTLTFAGDQATLDWSFKDQSIHLPIGMDNLFRTTPFDQTEDLSLFHAIQKPLGPIFFALRGSWTSDDTFVLTLQILNSNNRHTVSFKFADDKVNLTHSETASSETVYFKGQVQAQ